MNCYELVLEQVERLKKEREEKIQKAKTDSELACEHIQRLWKEIESALDSFKVDNRIMIEIDRHFGHSIYYDNVLLANLIVQFETWENPNCDWKVEESGYVIRWNIFDKHGDKIVTGIGVNNSFPVTIGREIFNRQ